MVEVHWADDAQVLFVRDSVTAWVTVTEPDRFDLR